MLIQVRKSLEFYRHHILPFELVGMLISTIAALSTFYPEANAALSVSKNTENSSELSKTFPMKI